MKKTKLMNFFILIVFLFSLLSIPAASPVQAQTPVEDEPEITRDTPYVPGEVVIGFEDSLPADQFSAKAAALAGEIGATVVDQSSSMALLSMDPDADVFAAADQLGEADGIKFAEPNYISWIPEEEPISKGIELKEVERSINGTDGEIVTISVDELLSMRTDAKKATYPNDEYTNWGNTWIAHDIIWPEKTASPLVCVVDSGVDYKHPDLKGRVTNGFDFVNNDGVPNDDNGHGTHVAGTISAKVNNGIGPAGISNGKVLAVKVLGAQGWGTDYNIARGIEYCANNKYVKVINMSLGGSSKSLAEWNALDYAINVKGKLVVAAAGNESTSDLHYPGGWAISQNTGPYGISNNIYQGLLSVGAIRSPFDSRDSMSVWVDTNGNRVKEDSETFKNGCAADFSNYGAWVEILAPGDGIYSTTPVNYPFYMNYFQGVSSGYDWLGGTSMAAPHVAAAAARAWSLDKYATNAEIEDLLIDTGDSVIDYLATDGYAFATFDANTAYSNDPFARDTNGDPVSVYYGEWFDYDLDGEDDTIIAPFCWPDANGPFDASHDMSNAVMLNVAAAMDRGALFTEVTDANTGLPLTGAKITAVDSWTNVTKGTSYMSSTTTRFVDIINLPAWYEYNLKVSKSGYTYGKQTFAWYNFTIPGTTIGFIDGMVGVPPKKEFSVVSNWHRWGYAAVDTFLFLPTSAPNGGGIVGPYAIGYGNLDLGSGNLYEYPYAFFNREGGFVDYLGVESISLRKGYMASPYYPGTYTVLLNDWNSGTGFEYSTPVVRVWYNGKIQAQVYQNDTCNAGEEWWAALQFERYGSTTAYTILDQCGTGDSGIGGVYPYAESNAVYGSMGQ